MRIAVLSDTHLPRGSRTLPPACVEQLKSADLIVHAGDFIALDVLRELEALGDLAAVYGNVDHAGVRAALPERRVVDANRARIGLIHDAGPARGRLGRLRRWFPEADAVVFGHSHLPLHERAPDGFQIFNPGSPTDRRRQPRHTMGVATVSDGRVEFELISLD
jgi:putative phosphoesterase